ncbi:MAG TPA: lysine-2,3-aminomutase-like protein [Alphaproteobacteria bacterium]|nr:lysine-2,3-aminomutase-like protein [Alphaproteobacteria bacterium]
MNKALSHIALRNLEDAGAVTPSPELAKVAEQFAVAITPAMMALIDPNDPNDPIAAQFAPSVEELKVHDHELADPTSDYPFSPTKGIVHRHPDRALLKLVHTCAVYCRFCFRREQLGVPENALNDEALDKAFDYLAAHPEIWEVIITGGDPLIVSDRRLKDVITRLNAIPHVKVIRIHTRMPVVDPSRITPILIDALRGTKPVYILLHCNHARELSDDARAACARFVDAGIPMLSQSVLLRGVNDDAESLEALMRAFVESRVKPHYLHHGDLARGTGHFRVSLAQGQSLLRGLRGISGLCQPNYILDIPGGHGKVPVNPVFAQESDGVWTVKDHTGCAHTYKDMATD